MENENTNVDGEQINENSEQMRILLALARWGRYPGKGGIDFEITNHMEEEIPKEESVKFAYCGPVGVCSPYDESIQKKNNGILKPTVEANGIFVLTEKNIFIKYFNKYKEEATTGMKMAFLKELKFVYDKKLLSVGQVQFFFTDQTDKDTCVITVKIMNDVYHINRRAKKHYETFKSELEEAVNFNASVYYLEKTERKRIESIQEKLRDDKGEFRGEKEAYVNIFLEEVLDMINESGSNNPSWDTRIAYLINKSALYRIIDLILNTEDNSDMYFENLIKNETFGQMNEKKLIEIYEIYKNTQEQKVAIING